MEVQEVIVLGRIAVIFVMYQVMIFFVCGADDVWMGWTIFGWAFA
jgi:type IV secretory pathway VirB6-like protein